MWGIIYGDVLSIWIGNRHENNIDKKVEQYEIIE